MRNKIILVPYAVHLTWTDSKNIKTRISSGPLAQAKPEGSKSQPPRFELGTLDSNENEIPKIQPPRIELRDVHKTETGPIYF